MNIGPGVVAPLLQKFLTTYHQTLYKSFVMSTRAKATVEPSSPRGCDIPPIPRVAASVLVETDHKDEALRQYLLVERGKKPAMGMWALPGGHVRFGERIVDAGLRELSEEASLTKKDLKEVFETTISTDAIYGNESHYAISTFVAVLPSEKMNIVKPADDAKNAKWFSLNQIKELREKKKLAGNVPRLIQLFKILRKGDI